jgi:penicillin-binding protein-related factor A (putative recombinase)
LNAGKRFEADFRMSVPEGIYCKKLADAAIGFDVAGSTQRFSPPSPFDFLLCRKGRMYALELKTTKESSFSYYGESANIKERQVEELLKAEMAGAVAGFVLNFRTAEMTFLIPASVLKLFMETSGKKSINGMEVKKLGVMIPGKKLRVNYRYDLSALWA